MKSDRFTDAQIMGVIRQAEGGVPVSDLAGSMGLATPRFTGGARNMAAWMLQ